MQDVLGVRIVPPRDRRNIRKDTYELRKIMGLNEVFYFPIIEFLELVLPQIDPEFYVEPVDDDLLPGRMAETVPEDHLIRVRVSVYDAACKGHTWARKIMAHELGHYIYHDARRVAYATPEAGAQIPKVFLPEYQADVFANGVPLGLAKGQLEQAAHTKVGRRKKKAAKRKSSTARQ